MNPILWKPNQESIKKSYLTDYQKKLKKNFGLVFKNYQSLHQWSVQHPREFWSSIWDYCNIITSKPPDDILVPARKMQETKWFSSARLNFAENLLRRRDNHVALFFAREDGKRSQLTYQQLFEQVCCIAHYLRSIGIKAGDRVIGFLTNTPEAVIAMLATTSIGAIWSSCSPDFGLSGLLDRFTQIEPSVLFAVDGHLYQQKSFQHLEKIQQLQEKIPSLKNTIIVPYLNEKPEIGHLSNAILYNEVLQNPIYSNQKDMVFEQLPFDHPIYILYSSGTTGKPKCIVHSAGGTLIQHMKELKLHCDLHPEDNIFFYTTCGWMMWNWLVSALALGASIILYDGSPFYSRKRSLYYLIDEFNLTHFGVGAKIIKMSAKYQLMPKNNYHLTSLKNLLTTGSPLLPENFDYIYQCVKKDVCVSSISGGTDIVSLFGAGNLNLPVYRGEIQCIGLGMDVQVFNDQGESVIDEKGELVCCSPFPCMPVSFWNDPDGKKYQAAYFEKFPNIWSHGDYAIINTHGGMIISGRSDATLNPGGVRIGTADIYNQIEKIPVIIDSLAVGQDWEGSERVILFVVLADDEKLTKELTEKIKSTIRKNSSPRHVPAKIIQVPDLPRTLSGKLVELAVKKIIHNEDVKNTSALANPESLDYFKNLPELKK